MMTENNSNTSESLVIRNTDTDDVVDTVEDSVDDEYSNEDKDGRVVFKKDNARIDVVDEFDMVLVIFNDGVSKDTKSSIKDSLNSKQFTVESPGGFFVPSSLASYIFMLLAMNNLDNFDGGVEAFGDGSIRFTPSFTKDSANYRWQGSDEFDEGHSRCGSCAHFIEGEDVNGCHVVQGEIDDEDYCEEFYSDVGLFAHRHEDLIEINLTLLGEKFDEWSDEDVDKLSDNIEDKLKDLLG